MTPTEHQISTAALVLGKLALIEPWAAKPDPGVAAAWGEVFATTELTREQLLAGAVALHADDTRRNDRPTLPSDVIRYARAVIRARARTSDRTVDEALQLNTAPPASPETREQAMREIRKLARKWDINDA